MMNSKLISSGTIIAKVIADLDLKEDQIRITDIREWIQEAVLKIGAVQQYEHKVEVIPVIGHQAQLPCDLYQLGQVAYSSQKSNGWLPMRKCTSSFGVFHDCRAKQCLDDSCLSDDKCCFDDKMLIPDMGIIPLVKNLFNYTDDRQALDKLNEDPNIRQTLGVLVNQFTVPTNNGRYIGNYSSGHSDTTMYSCDLQYMTKPGYIMLNVPKGFVKVSYYANYSDMDGMPMIPDLESYKEAIYWYVVMKLMYPKKLKGEISQGDYYDIRNSYNFYRKQAYAEAMMPNTSDEMETIKNTWTKLYPEFDDHSTFFSTTGDEQIIYNQNL